MKKIRSAMTDRPVIILENRLVFVNPEEVEGDKLQAARYGTLLTTYSDMTNDMRQENGFEAFSE
jgi:hypothetical protein